MRHQRSFCWSAVTAVAAMLLVSVAAAQDSTPLDDQQAESSQPARSLEADHPDVPGGFDLRRQAIEESLKTGKAPIWAGHYYEGDGLGANIELTLAPDAGVTVSWHGCLGLYGANHGAVVESPDGVLRMSFVAPNNARQFGNFPDELTPVTWGERQYLIPSDRIAEFVSAINHGAEPRQDAHGRFLLRDGDETKPATGLPALPPSVQAKVRQVSVEVKVKSVKLLSHKEEDGFCSNRYTVRVVATTAAVPPLFVGESLKALGYRYANADVTALQGGTSADAEIAVYDCDPAETPQAGDRFTTGAYKEGQGGDEHEDE